MIILLSSLLIAAAPLQAQWFTDRLTLQAGAGVALPSGSTSEHAGNGTNFMAGAGVRFHSGASLRLNFSNQQMDADTFDDIGKATAVDADMRMWSLTLNPTFDFIRLERFSSYIDAGYGLYNRRLQLTRADFNNRRVCDSWWGLCSVGAGAGNPLVGVSTYKGGFNIGTGITIGSAVRFFAEARYHRMFIANTDTEVIPVTFGARW
jgi:opacity protein-like surface antigen